MCDSVFRQLSVGTTYLLPAGVPFGKRSGGRSARLSCGLGRSLSVSRSDCSPPVDDDVFPLFQSSPSEGLKDWWWLRPALPPSFHQLQPRTPTLPAWFYSRGQHPFFSYLFNLTALGSSAGGGCYKRTPLPSYNKS